MKYNAAMKKAFKYGLYIIALLGFIAGEIGLGVSMLIIAIIYTITTAK